MITAQLAFADRSRETVSMALRPRLGLGQPASVFAALLLALVGTVLVLGAASPSPVGIGRAAGHDRAAGRGLAGLPVAAQGAVSRALGRDDPSYRALALAGRFRLRNPGQDLVALLGTRGIEVRSGRAWLHLSLSGYGYGGELRVLPAATLRAKSNRVVYRRGRLREWYANGPLGLEQGFTLPAAPTGRRTGALEIALALSGNVRGSLSRGAGAVTFTGPGGTTLTYGGLIASDARGRTLPARIELRRGRLLLRVDDAGARYPLRIDPLIQQGAKLTASGESGAAGFGYKVAFSSDGNTALIGGPNDNGNVGAVWVFTRSGSTWTQQGAKLTASDEITSAQFGHSVALSSDGNTALIGGPIEGGAGAAWVFTRSGSTWTQQGAKLTGTGKGEFGEFGYSVALSEDGNTALIGDPLDNSEVGAVWVFTRSGSTWTQQGAKLTGSGESGGGAFGYSVALSSDGNTALISGVFDNGVTGAAWVFTRSGSTWTQQGEKLAAGNFEFGRSVALSSDGNTALIASANEGDRGAAWVFTRSGSTWTQQGATLTAGGESGEGGFGWSVALSSDGNTALIGGPFDDNNVGAAWVFTRSGSTWTQQGAKLTGSGETGNGQFGFSVAFSSGASTALIGGPADNMSVGAAWVFVPLTAPANTAPPAISGTAQQGQMLTAVTGSWTNSPTSFTHQWQRCDASGNNCAAIPGATGQTYTLTAADVDSKIAVQETARNEAGAGTPASSAAVGPIIIAPPANTAPPTISGTAQQGQTLTEAHGAWTNSPTSYGYQWKDCDSSANNCTPIAGATSQTYTVTVADVGSTIRVQETASNAAGSGAPANSAQTAVVQAPPSSSDGGTSDGGGSTGAGATTSGKISATVSSAQIAALLAQLVTPTGKAAKIASLLKTGGFTLTFRALEAGTAVIDWYQLPHGVKLAKKTKAKAKPVLVASGKLTFSAAGTATIKIDLTAVGKSLLKHAKLIKLIAKDTFTPTGKTPISATKVFMLKR